MNKEVASSEAVEDIPLIERGDISSYEIDEALPEDSTEYKIAQLEQMARVFVEIEEDIYIEPEQSADNLWAKVEPRLDAAKLSEDQQYIFAEGFRHYERVQTALADFIEREKKQYLTEKGLIATEKAEINLDDRNFNNWLGRRLLSEFIGRSPEGEVYVDNHPLGFHLIAFDKEDYPWKFPGNFFPDRALPGTNITGCLSVELAQGDQDSAMISEVEFEETQHAIDLFMDRVNRFFSYERFTGLEEIERKFMARTKGLEYVERVFERSHINELTEELPGIYKDARDEIISHFLRSQALEHEREAYLDPDKLAQTLNEDYDFVYHRGPMFVRNFSLLRNPYAAELENILQEDIERACRAFHEVRLYYEGSAPMATAMLRGFDIRTWPAMERLIKIKIDKYGPPEFLDIWYPEE